MEKMGHTWAEIDMDALTGNFQTIRECCSQKIYAVIKADAYGHGAVPVARALDAQGADGFAVATLEEAIELRENGIEKPVLILGFTPPEAADQLVQYDVMQCIYSLDFAKALNDNAKRGRVKGHLKLDTGMGRIGFDCRSEETPGIEEAKQVLLLENLDMVGVFMHFAEADTPTGEEFTKKQYRLFLNAVEKLEETGHRFAEKHCRNSAGTLLLPEEKTDAVRAGIVLYGLTPSTDIALPEGFLPVMSLYSRVSLVKTVAPGETVSYGRTYTAPETRKIATVTARYADGVPRLISNRGCVLIRGQRANIVGRVCMDQFCVDVTDIADVRMGDVVTVFGPGLPVEEVAAAAETIHYEVICGIPKRVPRIYK